MAYILYSQATSTTGRNLARYLGMSHGTRPAQDRPNLLIRWGTSAQVPQRPRNILNRRDAILAATNKLAVLQTLPRVDIPAPPVLTLTPETDFGRIRFPALARNVAHTQGRDIVLCMQRSDAVKARDRMQKEYLVEYVPTKYEFRAHVFNGSVIKVSKKMPDPAYDGDDFPWIRNRDTGYRYVQAPNFPQVIRSVAISAVQALGLHFGAVDIIVSDTNQPYVLEVNTGPGLIASGIEAYGQAIIQYALNELNLTFTAHPEVLAEMLNQEHGNDEETDETD